MASRLSRKRTAASKSTTDVLAAANTAPVAEPAPIPAVVAPTATVAAATTPAPTTTTAVAATVEAPKTEKKKRQSKKKAAPAATATAATTTAAAPADAAAVAKADKKAKVVKPTVMDISMTRVRNYIDRRKMNATIEVVMQELKEKHVNQEGKITDDIKKLPYKKDALSDDTKKLIAEVYQTYYHDKKTKYDQLVATLGSSTKDKDKERLAKINPFPTIDETYKGVVNYICKKRIRFSSCSAITITAMLEYIVIALVNQVFKYSKENAKAFISEEYLFLSEIDPVICPLIRNLPIIKDYKTTAAEEAKKPKKAKEDAKDAEVQEAAAEPEEGNEQQEINFKCYISKISKNIKEKLMQADKAAYEPIKIKSSFVDFTSNVITQVIDRFVPLLNLYTSNNHSKTITQDSIMFIINFIYTDAAVNTKQLVDYVETKKQAYIMSKHGPPAKA